ncbi:MAG: hypothetical protein AAF401_15885 [Pseudomonadota bacterium]
MDTLPPLAAAELRSAVEAGGLWLLGHPGVAEVEATARAYRQGPEAGRLLQDAAAVTDVLEAHPEMIEAEATDALREEIETAGGDTPAAGLSQGATLGGINNFFSRVGTALKRARDGAKDGLVTLGGLAGGLQVIVQVFVRSEATFGTFISTHMPGAMPWFDTLMQWLRMIAL